MKLQKLFILQVLLSLLSNLPHGVLHSNVKKWAYGVLEKKSSSKNSMAILKIYFMEYSIAMKNKQHMAFFETKSSFKDSTAFKEIYLMEYSIGMQKSKIWSSSMASSFKDSMTNYKFYLMEYSIIMQRKRHMEFFKQTKKKKKGHSMAF